MIAFVLAAGLFTTLLLGDRSEARLRFMQGPSVAFDLATTPTARIDMRDRRTDFSFGYAPSFTLGDVQTGGNFQLFHTADATLSFIARRTALAVSTSDSYGDYNFAYLLPTSTTGPGPPPPPQIVPTAATIRYGGSRAAATLRRTWRRFALSLFAEHSVAGGLDATSRQVVPLLSTPNAWVSVMSDVTRSDQLSTDAKATLSNSTPHPCNPATGGPPLPTRGLRVLGILPPMCAPNEEWAELRETWRHALSRRSTITAAAGAAAVRTQLNPGATETFTAMPTGELILMHDFGAGRPWQSLLRVGARLQPLVDIRYAIVESRVDTSATWTFAYGRDSVATTVSFVRSVPPTTIDATYLNFAVEALRKVDKRFEMGVGARGAWQHDAFTGAYFVAGLYGTLVWHEPRLRL